MGKHYRQWALLIFLVVTVQACSTGQSGEVHLAGRTMGTTYNVKYVPDSGPEPTKLQQEMDELLVHINQLMSTYIDTSELSKLNQWHSDDPYPLSEETQTVVQEALRLGAMSEGVLDVTVGPLVNMWGFGPQARPEKVPTDTEILAVKQRVGLDKFTLQNGEIRKQVPDLYIDLSTIAKGYAVDRLAEVLEKHGLNNYLVEIGGEMRLAGKKASGKDWVVAVEKPLTNERAIQKLLVIGDNALATSGDYRNYYEEEGVRYSHLIDPRTGYPINHNLVAVTVVHPSSMTADGLATALNVMGKDQALRIAEQNNLAVLLITRENTGFKEYTSASFDALVRVL